VEDEVAVVVVAEEKEEKEEGDGAVKIAVGNP